jgi:GrpB-like predicted nucleotidyltransferase (UPF0157 family)
VWPIPSTTAVSRTSTSFTVRKAANSLDRAIHEEVRLAPYSKAWLNIFGAERDRLLKLFPQLLQVEHLRA